MVSLNLDRCCADDFSEWYVMIRDHSSIKIKANKLRDEIKNGCLVEFMGSGMGYVVGKNGPMNRLSLI